jgi:hypothetical protein
MKPQEKAREIVNKYIDLSDYCDCLEYSCICFTMYEYKAKQCALIAVDELLNADWFIPTKEDFTRWSDYWKEVKQEIENL